MREAEDSGVCWCEALGSAGAAKQAGGRFQTAFHRRKGATYSAAARTSPRGHAGMGLGKREELLATTGRGDGRWDGRQLKVTQDARDHRLLGAGGNDGQRATAAKRHVAISRSTMRPSSLAQCQ